MLILNTDFDYLDFFYHHYLGDSQIMGYYTSVCIYTNSTAAANDSHGDREDPSYLGHYYEVFAGTYNNAILADTCGKSTVHLYLLTLSWQCLTVLVMLRVAYR